MIDTDLPDGVYIGLPFEEYIAQAGRLGSTDKGRLHKHGPGYWWSSPMNPYYVRVQSEDLLEGEGLHALLLEGLGPYEERFKTEPDKRDYTDVLFTIPQIKAALTDAGVSVKGSSGFRLAEWAEGAAVDLPGRTVWHNVMADFERSIQIRDDDGEVIGKRKSLSAEQDFMLRAMRDAALDDHPDNADVRELLTVAARFPILAEVSILWTDEFGRRHRARFDKLIPPATVDLKSLGNWEGRQVAHMIGDHINRMGYDIQEADYQIARREGWRMILEDEGNLHGGTEEERQHVLAIANWNQTTLPHWSWLFFQKPDKSGRAPILFPLMDKWGGPYHRSGFRKRAKALALYDQCMERFGPDRPWSKVHPLHYTTEAHEPHITTGHWGFDDEPVEGEAEHFLDGRD
jgi:hypothetical protein